MKPIIKWVGGKAQLLDKIHKLMPLAYKKYYEPFLGGGAVLLDLNPKEAVAGDTNFELINMYLQVRDRVENVITYLNSLDAAQLRAPDPKGYYYRVRENFNKNLDTLSIEQAARFIYLNKHCFNGLYRVNSKGEFNVPFNGKITGNSCDPDHLRQVSKQLQNVRFQLRDFERCVADAQEGDLIFFDSPYAPLTPTSFTDYTKEGFSYEDHVRLSKVFKELSDKGCYCILTNHDTELIRDLYKDYNITEVDVRRSINRNGSNRKGKEVIITNYDPKL